MSDDVSLKKLLKKKKKRLLKFTFGGDSETAELELERLCKLKQKVISMKEKLTRIQRLDVKGSDEGHSNEQPSIVYVPTAVLREKTE